MSDAVKNGAGLGIFRRPASRERAKEAAQRFIDEHFGNLSRERPHTGIPAGQGDDDIVLMDYIMQQEDRSERIGLESRREALTLCMDWIEEQRQKILGNPDDPSWTEHLAEVHARIEDHRNRLDRQLERRRKK